MKTKPVYMLSLLALIVFFATDAAAHFGMMIPSDPMVMQGENRTITLDLSFSHPFEGNGMELEKPRAFGFLTDSGKENLLNSLRKTKILGHTAWKTSYRIRRPGVYTFFMIPRPYWEPAEDTFIIHYTKTVVAAFGDEEGWDREIGLDAEIVPLTRPFGLYSGNVFQGIVKMKGRAVPFSRIEVEYYNKEKKHKAPNDYMVTQTLRSDQNGVFTYAAPWAGWWGFAALNTADYTLKHDGRDKKVEIGAIIWVEFLQHNRN